MGTRIKLTASDGFTFNAYRADTSGKPRGGVVLYGEIWGLNSWVRSVADRWASHGYLCIAPAMFDRVELGYESDDYTRSAAPFFEKYSQQTALLDMAAAVQAAAAGGKVGVTGYCFGGANTWRSAAQVDGVAAASGYYGGGIPNYINLKPRCPTEMHYGTQDQGIPLEQVELLKEQHPTVDVYTYEANHGFCNSDRPERFDEAACTKASARSLAFFHKHLG
jgi:carboxymethylenebutenolidase